MNLFFFDLKEKDHTLIPYIKLWRAFLNRLTSDANYKGSNKRRLRVKNNAINWVIENNEEFKIVCSFARIDPAFAETIILNENIGLKLVHVE